MSANKPASKPSVDNTPAPTVHPLLLVASQQPVVAAPKPVTKKQQVIDMLSAPEGTTVARISETLLISKVAARSLIGDVRHAKVRVTQSGGVYKLA